MGRIIEVVSGLSYAEFMEQRVFQPLGMTHTTFWPSEEQIKTLAKTYRFNAGKTGSLEEAAIEPFTYPLTNHSASPCPPVVCFRLPPIWRDFARCFSAMA